VEETVKLIPAKCPSCGANIELPDHLKSGYCTHCGGKVLIDEDRVEVHHTGAVSSLPLCPNCGNTLTEGNRLFSCELCGKKACYVCSKLSERENTHFTTARAWGRQIHNADLALCRECAKQRLVTCTGCDGILNQRYMGQPTGKCSMCQGRGTTGILFTRTCSQCHGTGRCPWCNGTRWVRGF